MRPEFKYGLIMGAGLCLWMVLEYLLGFHTTRVAIGEYSGYFSSLVPLATLFLLLKEKQAEAPSNPLGLGAGLGAGLAASFIAGVIVFCFLVGYSQFINPGWLDSTLDWKVARWRAHGMAETDIRRQITFYRQAHSPSGLIATTVAGLTLMCGIFSLGLTFLMRRRSRAPGSVE